MRRSLAVAGLLVASLTAACSSAGDASTSSSRVEFQTTRMTSGAGQPEVLLHTKEPVKGLVLFMHGFASDEEQLLDNDNLFPLRDAVLSAGYALAASDSHGNNVGSPRSVADQADLVADVQRRLPGVRPVGVVGFSMGGLDALLVAAHGAVAGLHSIVLLSPVTDIRPYLDSRFGDDIAEAYGNPDESGLRRAVTAASPVTLPPSDFARIRLLFWHSPDDSVVPQSQSRTIVARLRAAGSEASLSNLTGDHGDLSALPVGEVVAAMTANR